MAIRRTISGVGFGEALKLLMNDRDMSVEQMESESGLSVSTVKRLRAGQDTLSEIDGQLRMDAAPVLPPTCPLFRNIHHRQIQHFQQTVVCLENALGFCDLPQLPIKAFDRVRGIDQTADFLRIFEVGAEVGPVFPPRLCDLGIFIVPVLRESLQSVQSSLLVHCCI